VSNCYTVNATEQQCSIVLKIIYNNNNNNNNDDDDDDDSSDIITKIMHIFPSEYPTT
jgi:hypothetical protein